MIKLKENAISIFLSQMKDSVSDNIIIIIVAIFNAAILIVALIFAKVVAKYYNNPNEKDLKKHLYYVLDISYTSFIGIISIFPLLGMLGTVVALIAVGANFQNGSNIDVGEFFLALTSTAYGIIFSIIYKLINSFVQPFIENQISKAKTILKIED